MYSVVGCGNCNAFWVVEGRPETTGCPRCGKRHRFDRLKRFAEAQEADAARQARAELLADREGYGEAFADLDSFGAMDGATDENVIDDATYLESAGIDADAVAAAGSRIDTSTTTRSNRQVVLDGLSALDCPTEADLREYAAEHGVSGEYTERLLEKLRRQGTVTETGGRYRRL